MKGKPGQVQEQVDTSHLTPWMAINCILKFDTKLTRSKYILQQMLQDPKSFTKNINREDIINYAKKKGYLVDPKTLNEKQLKDPKTMSELPLELTPKILVKSYIQYTQDLDVQGKKDKFDNKQRIEKELQAAKEPQVKDTKKDAKKGGKVDVVQIEEVKVIKKIEKEYKKANDMIYFLNQIPQDVTELLEINNQKQQIDLVLYIQQRVPPIIVEEEEPRNEANQEEDEEEEKAHQEENMAKKIQEQEALTQEDLNFMKENKKFIQCLKSARSSATRESSIRKTVVKEIIYDVDPFNESESLKAFIEQLMEEICAFSLDQVQFKEWIAKKKVVPLQKPDLEEVKREAARKLEEQLAAQKAAAEKLAAAKLAAEQEVARQKELKKAKKDTKKGGKDVVQEEVKEIHQIIKVEEKVEDEVKEPDKNPLLAYKKQLKTVKLEETGAGIMLEILLDQMDSEKGPIPPKKDPRLVRQEKELTSVFEILAQPLALELNLPKSEEPPKTRSQDNFAIIEEADEIRRQTVFQEKLESRERLLREQMKFPGINRWQMPEIATKSIQSRNTEKCQVYPFVDNVQDFERRESILRFENILKEQDPDYEWDLGDRVFIEKHSKNTLAQTLYKQLLFETQIVSKYNDRDDNLYLTLFYKNPQGRMMRQKWSADWKFLPNLENWITFFKNNENNLKNELYYDFDYELIGNFHEYTKLLFPSDDSVIIGTKYQIGDQFNFRYKILKEGVVLGVKEDAATAQFYAYFDNETRFLVSIDPSQDNSSQEASITMTLVNGLVVKFLKNGDVFQQILCNDDSLKEESVEVKRIINGKGSVIRYLSDGSMVIYYANGNISKSHTNDTWITTNNKGLRKIRRDGLERMYEPLKCAKKTDPQTKNQIFIRDDQTVIIHYADGRVLSKFKDGTQILTSADKSYIIVEHVDYATVKVSYGGGMEKIVLPFQDARGQDNLFERSNDGRIVETFLFDGTRVLGYKEVSRQKEGTLKANYVHLVFFEDGAVSKVTNEGDIVFISSVDRLEMQGGYWSQLFCSDDDRSGGAYTCSLNLGQLWTQDNQGNFFSIYSNGEIDYSIKEIDVYNMQVEEKLVRPITPGDLQDGDFIDEELKVLQKPTKFKHPRLFIINNENRGYEFLNLDQFKNYQNIKNNDSNTFIQSQKLSLGVSHSYITRFTHLKQRRTTLINCDIPALDILTLEEKKSVNNQIQFLMRNVFEYEKITPATREKHLKDLETFDLWRKDQFRQQLEYGAGRKEKSERLRQAGIQLKILENIRSNYQDSSPEDDLIYQASIFKHNQPMLDEFQKFLSGDVKAKLSNLDPKAYNIQPPRGVSLNYQIDYIQLISFELEQRKKKPPVQEPIVPKEKQYRKITTIEEKQNESAKQQLLKDSIVRKYFNTVEGQDAFKDMLTNGTINLNPNKVARTKYTMEEVTGKTTQELEQLEMVLSQVQEQQNLPTQPEFQQVYKKTPKQKTIQIKPSIFAKRDLDEFNRQMREVTHANFQRQMKLNNINLYGKERKEGQVKSVSCLLQTNPNSELNAKYILSEAQTDNRMKISSMQSRMYMKAPGISHIRNTGAHTALAATIDKKYNLDVLESQKNLMIQSDIQDKLRKDLLIYPIVIRYGMLRAGGLYETTVTIKNEDILAQRIILKQTLSKNVRVFMQAHGPIALGLTREITVRIQASNEIFGRFSDEFQIISKHKIYKIPVFANIIDAQEFDKIDEEIRQIKQRPLLKANIREVRYDQEQLLRIRTEPNDTQNSDLLPKLKNSNKEYKLDPYAFAKKKQTEQEDSFQN